MHKHDYITWSCVNHVLNNRSSLVNNIQTHLNTYREAQLRWRYKVHKIGKARQKRVTEWFITSSNDDQNIQKCNDDGDEEEEKKKSQKKSKKCNFCINRNKVSSSPHYSPYILSRFSHALISDFGSATSKLLNTIDTNHRDKQRNDTIHDIMQCKKYNKFTNDVTAIPQANLVQSGTLEYHSPEVLFYNGMLLLLQYLQHEQNEQLSTKNEITSTSTSIWRVKARELSVALIQLQALITSEPVPIYDDGDNDTIKDECIVLLSKTVNLGQLFENLHQNDSQIKQDIWALGITLYTLAFQMSPFTPPEDNDNLHGFILSLTRGMLINAMTLQTNINLMNNHVNHSKIHTTNNNNNNNRHAFSAKTPSITFPVFPIAFHHNINHERQNNTVQKSFYEQYYSSDLSLPNIIFSCPRSLSLQLFIAFILHPNPSYRPHINTILHHPIIKMHDFANRLKGE